MRRLLARASIVARTDSTVVISGETGTGKEVVARLVHSNSARQARPFIAVNVAAIPAELLESELFGHVKGAFTGATSTTEGLFGEAHGGTLMLDEIGEMPAGFQAKLLRVLQEGEVRRVGETRSRCLDVRIVSATNRDLRALVAGGGFREDLYYRLKVLSLVVPPLRERREDIFPLANMFAQRLHGSDLHLSPRARTLLEGHPFPGNVRQLGNVIDHAVAFAGEGSVDLEHFPEDIMSDFAAPPRATRDRLVPLAQVEREHVNMVLSACGNNQVEAARVLGVSRSTLWRKLTSYQRNRPSDGVFRARRG
jgi:two-component system response regulator HydG